ncbi:MAG: putative negative regulator of RcsB-dependent stress response [Bacteroidia bacterium]|jgi:predicted negative regulator of RcsB-dependent stress response
MNNEEQNNEEVVKSKPFSVIQYIEDNSKNLMYAGIALVVVAAGFWYYTSILTPKKNGTANDELYQAEAFFESDSLDLALNGNGDNILGLRDVADEYGSTPAGERAKFLSARALMEKGSFDEALEYLESVSFDDEMVAPLARCLEGDCQVQLENFDAGLSMYLKAAKMRDNTFTTPYCYMKAARLQMKIEDWAGALKSLQVVEKEYKSSQYAINVDKEIAFVKAAIK